MTTSPLDSAICQALRILGLDFEGLAAVAREFAFPPEAVHAARMLQALFIARRK